MLRAAPAHTEPLRRLRKTRVRRPTGLNDSDGSPCRTQLEPRAARWTTVTSSQMFEATRSSRREWIPKPSAERARVHGRSSTPCRSIGALPGSPRTRPIGSPQEAEQLDRADVQRGLRDRGPALGDVALRAGRPDGRRRPRPRSGTRLDRRRCRSVSGVRRSRHADRGRIARPATSRNACRRSAPTPSAGDGWTAVAARSRRAAERPRCPLTPGASYCRSALEQAGHPGDGAGGVGPWSRLPPTRLARAPAPWCRPSSTPKRAGHAGCRAARPGSRGRPRCRRSRSGRSRRGSRRRGRRHRRRPAARTPLHVDRRSRQGELVERPAPARVRRWRPPSIREPCASALFASRSARSS